MLVVNGHAKHRRSLCRVGYGKAALSMNLKILQNKRFLTSVRNEQVRDYISPLTTLAVGDPLSANYVRTTRDLSPLVLSSKENMFSLLPQIDPFSMCVYRIPQGTNYTRAACDYCYAHQRSHYVSPLRSWGPNINQKRRVTQK